MAEAQTIFLLLLQNFFDGPRTITTSIFAPWLAPEAECSTFSLLRSLSHGSQNGFARGGQHLRNQRTMFNYGDRSLIFSLSMCQFL